MPGPIWPDASTFTNPQKRIAHQHLASLHPEQKGTIGDLTASRKVRVYDVPLQDALEMIDRKETPPEHMANSLYLEWFSERNGRVVIESADYELTISPPEWRMTSEENEERAKQAASGMEDFMQRLDDSIEVHKKGQKDPEEPWDEHDYEKFLKESDARTDKYMELLDKYGDSDEAEARIAKEMGWDRELTEEEAEEETDALMKSTPPARWRWTSLNLSLIRNGKESTGFERKAATCGIHCSTAALKARSSSGIRLMNSDWTSWRTRIWNSSFLSFKPPARNSPEH